MISVKLLKRYTKSDNGKQIISVPPAYPKITSIWTEIQQKCKPILSLSKDVMLGNKQVEKL